MAHIHGVFDSDVHFSIDPISRAIKNEAANAKTKIVQYDHNSERFTFELPRFIDGHDMKTCNVVQVHYINIGNATDKSKGLYEVDDLQVSPEDKNVVICSWLISQNATQFVGTLNFVLRFICTTDGVVDYSWSTAIYNAIVVAEAINNSDIVVEQYADVLVQWRKELFGAVGVLSVNGIEPDAEGNVEIDTAGIFIAEYGKTTLDEVSRAYMDGKLCFMKTVSEPPIPMIGFWEGHFASFEWFNNGEYFVYSVDADGWDMKCTRYNKTYQITEYSTDDEIPTAKAVWDLVGSIDTSGEQGVMIVTVSGGSSAGSAYSANRTYEEMLAELVAGKSVLAVWNGRMFTATGRDPGRIYLKEFIINGYGRACEFVCSSADVWTCTAVDLPSGADIQPLTFTGAVEATYDGSEPVEVAIPQGGGGGEKWELLQEFDFDAETKAVEITDNISDISEIVVVLQNTGTAKFTFGWLTHLVNGNSVATMAGVELSANKRYFSHLYLAPICYAISAYSTSDAFADGGKATFISNLPTTDAVNSLERYKFSAGFGSTAHGWIYCKRKGI